MTFKLRVRFAVREKSLFKIQKENSNRSYKEDCFREFAKYTNLQKIKYKIMTATKDTNMSSDSETKPIKTDMVRRMTIDRRKSIIETHALEKRRDFHCCPCYIPKRVIMVILCFLGMFVIHAMRVNVAVAVVTLIDETAHAKVGSHQAISNVSVNFLAMIIIAFIDIPLFLH